jgi:hypothetical protein
MASISLFLAAMVSPADGPGVSLRKSRKAVSSSMVSSSIALSKQLLRRLFFQQRP